MSEVEELKRRSLDLLDRNPDSPAALKRALDAVALAAPKGRGKELAVKMEEVLKHLGDQILPPEE